jgi:hypothetical protein
MPYLVGTLCGTAYAALLMMALRLTAPGLFHPPGALRRVEYVGLMPTGFDGTFSRADYLRSALLCLGGFIAGMGAAVLAMLGLGLDARNDLLEWIAVGLAFGSLLLALVSGAAMLVYIARAIWWQPRRLASEWPNEECPPGKPF